MRHLALALAALAAPLVAGDNPAPPPAPAAEVAPAAEALPQGDELRKQVSYLVGLRLKAMVDRAVTEGELDRAEMLRALADDGTTAGPDQARQQALFEAYDAQLQARRNAGAADQLKDNAAFLADHGKKPGITTTASGLQYEVISRGPEGGKSPKSSSTVRVHYTGTKRDGTIFDSSVQRGEPAEFPLSGVIKGWTEGLQLMREGDKFRFTIPSELAYGAQGPGPIGANAVLIFDVELIKIVE